MAALTTNIISRDGLDLTAADTAAGAGGDTFDNDGATFLYVDNAGGSNCVITIAVATDIYSSDPIQSTVAVVATVTLGTIFVLGPYPTSRYGSNIAVAYDQVVTVTVAAVRLPSA